MHPSSVGTVANATAPDLDKLSEQAEGLHKATHCIPHPAVRYVPKRSHHRRLVASRMGSRPGGYNVAWEHSTCAVKEGRLPFRKLHEVATHALSPRSTSSSSYSGSIPWQRLFSFQPLLTAIFTQPRVHCDERCAQWRQRTSSRHLGGDVSRGLQVVRIVGRSTTRR